ncbi:MAG: O-antigen ligase family protein, partial [Candidatus Magasanikbacteria bacterium]|nr:O-antigen ligase family protein [Candidatus Magasanikbacteria bacterium]
IFLLAGFLVMFIAWLQTQNPNLLLNQGSDRVSSTLGNPIYLGGYGIFLTFLALLLFKKENNGLWKIFYAIAGLFGFMGIFWSGTRGDMLGLVAASVFAVISYIVVLKNYPKVRYGLVGLGVFGIISISLLYNFKQTNFVQGLPAIGRAVNTSFEDIKNSPRWIAWQIAWESFKEKPLFGWSVGGQTTISMLSTLTIILDLWIMVMVKLGLIMLIIL